MTVFALHGPAMDHNIKSDAEKARAENNSQLLFHNNILSNCTEMVRFLPGRGVSSLVNQAGPISILFREYPLLCL